jgi:hypothetical protein
MDIRHTLRHLLVPHHTNNQRAKVLHVDALFGYVLLLMIFNLAIRSVHHTLPGVLGYATDIHAEQLLSATNAQRAAAGLSALSNNAALAAAAVAKAQDMFANGYWAHNSPDGATPWTFITGAGYRYTLAGENLAKNFQTSQSVMDAWMASPTHRDNIVKAGYRDVGFAVVNGVLNGEETTLVVQMFGATQSLAVAPVQAAPPVEIPPAAAATTPAPTRRPIATATPIPTPTIVSGGAQPVASAQPATPAAFSSVLSRPLFDIPTVTRDVAFVFMGILGGVLAVDAVVVRRRHIVRLVGHNLAHMLFLGALTFISLGVARGSLI